jgi:hypothetical protein
MLSIANIVTELTICKTVALAIPRFYKRTGISAQLGFAYSKENESIEISFSYEPREPNEKEYSIFFEEITDAEKILTNEYLINSALNCENIKQLVFKHKEDMRQTIDKQKHNV